jgi:hypothetical protein
MNDVIFRTVLCYVAAMKPMYFIMKVVVFKGLYKEKKSHFSLDFSVKICVHTAPLFTTVCPDERHVCGYEMALLRCQRFTLFLNDLQ